MQMKTISLVEYGEPKKIITEIAEDLGVPPLEVTQLILNAGERIKDTLSFSNNPFTITGESIRAIDFAGILRVSPSLVIEVAPKFLGLDSDNDRWREDFLYLATISKNGTLLNTDRIISDVGQRGDLYTLITRAYIEMFWENYRRPIRSYKKRRFVDFSIDGEVEPESIYAPSLDGFEQSMVILDRKNQFNAVMLAATRQLIKNLKEPNLIIQMNKVIQLLSPQSEILSIGNLVKHRLPNRSSQWQRLYNLSVDIVKGFGLVYRNGSLNAPGYVLKSWKVWEDLLSLAITRGFGIQNVIPQKDFKLGSRQRGIKEPTTVNVIPDLVVTIPNSNPLQKFVFDAKYKGHVEKGALQISGQDLYESLAFAEATNCNLVILAYPCPATSSNELSLGGLEVFEQIQVNGVTIIGIEVETKGISLNNGIMQFSKELSNNCINLIDKMGQEQLI
jgi:5-methylcytosine-specific restriction enzyme subunit McrC